MLVVVGGHSRNIGKTSVAAGLIRRLRDRNSQEMPELANPGETYHLTVDLWATSNVFLAGHKLRLEVSSSNFPRFDRNLNTGGHNYDESKAIVAHNVVHHSAQYPSSVVVTVVRK